MIRYFKTHFSTGFIIVQIHQAPIVSFGFSRVGESFGQRGSRSDVGRTATPFPSVSTGSHRTSSITCVGISSVGGVARPMGPAHGSDQVLAAPFGRIATARADSSLAARLGDSVRQAGAPHCIQISRFSASCKKKKQKGSTTVVMIIRSKRRIHQTFFLHWKIAIGWRKGKYKVVAFILYNLDTAHHTE